MSGLIITALVVLVFIVIYQVSKASELAVILKGEEKVRTQVNKLMAWLWVAFFILGLIGIYKCHVDLIDKMLPEAASTQGAQYDFMMMVTLVITGFVFFATHALLFYFSFRYQATEKSKSYYYPHNNKLEILWTTIPALVLLILVVVGLRTWFTMTDEAPEDSLLVEITGKQFNFIIRYPGADGVFGERNFRLINDATNPLGLDWNDPASKDDIIIENGEMHIIKDRHVKLIIASRDVLHSIGLPHFRMTMDAVPGILTTLWFTPTISTEEMKKKTNNPNFVYEISCREMCGKSHYAMRGTVVVETEDQFKRWISEQPSYYSNLMQNSAPATTDSVQTTEPPADSVALSPFGWEPATASSK